LPIEQQMGEAVQGLIGAGAIAPGRLLSQMLGYG